ncbi:DUF1003 domain-containing protein [Kitasatospora sp. NPDC058965]|uniref:DUF1003 domain-containing protein n=1 Tax=Kitasatospora sp. NPDC058965 TaxID=3346682 RepID=UPI0036BF976C
MSTAGTVTDPPQQSPVATPVTRADERIGINGAMAAALTRVVGSMPALYVVLAVFACWMVLATVGPLHQVDPYPFGFLLFLDNVVQLALCLAILVGQRVLGMAADRRSVQTYESAETIFERVADLQEHLDRHDRMLGRGMSLLESSPHPWIERHRVQRPPQAVDQLTTLNGRIAAWLTTRLGSMWAFYLAAVTQLLWIGLSALGVQRFDPYPFAFMSFLSTLAQLLFMIVIMVGQDVLGQAADRRSEQTLLDAEAILHECRRMKARLVAQDRVIESLADYTSAQVTRQLARAVYESRQSVAGPGPQAPPWTELPEEVRAAKRVQARRLGDRLAEIGCLMVPSAEPVSLVAFSEEETEALARLEHRQQQTLDAGQLPGQRPVPWEDLGAADRDRALAAVRRLPAILAEVGFQILRTSQNADGPGELDFTPEEWETLGRALMAAGVLVALAEGIADPEEISALVQLLRETGISGQRRFLRELAAASTFETGLHANTRYAEYAGPALATIRAATAIVARTAPGELADFRAFLLEIATVVADANDEGGFLGIGAGPRVPNELAAMAAVRAATEADPAELDPPA